MPRYPGSGRESTDAMQGGIALEDPCRPAKSQQVEADAMMSFVQEPYPKFKIQLLGRQQCY